MSKGMDEILAAIAGAADVPVDDPAAPPDLPPPGVKVLSVLDFLSKPPPPREWCVDDWIPSGQVTSLYGDGGTGKSILALQLALATAAGRDWLGLRTSRRKVLYVSCEDDEGELHRRIVAIAASDCITADELVNDDGAPRFTFLDTTLSTDPSMMDFPAGGPATITRFGRFIEQHARAAGAQLIIIDTLADVFAGNEIVRRDVRRFVSHCRRLAQSLAASVILLAHPSVSGGATGGTGHSGSTAWRGSVRSMLTFEKEGAEDDAEPSDVRLLTRRKANYAPDGAELRLRYSAGAFVPLAPPSAPSALDQVADERLFVDKLQALLDRGLCPSKAKNRTEYAPLLMRRTFPSDLQDIPIARLERAMGRLLETGEVVVKRTRENSSPLCPRDYDIKLFRRG